MPRGRPGKPYDNLSDTFLLDACSICPKGTRSLSEALFVRHAKLKMLMDETMSLREYVNNMTELAKRYQDGRHKAGHLTLTNAGASSFLAAGQTVQFAQESLFDAREALMGRKVPHFGPEVLREAALLLRVTLAHVRASPAN